MSVIGRLRDRVKGALLPRTSKVVVGADQMAGIREHAARAYPDECCGILVGVRGSALEVHRSHAAANQSQERARDRYQLDPREIHRVDVASERDGLEIIGFYHSHPDHPPAPSLTDAEHAWPGYVYLITAVTADGAGETKAFTYDEQRARFDEQPIEITPSLQLCCGVGIRIRR